MDSPPPPAPPPPSLSSASSAASSDRWLALTLRLVLVGLFLWMVKGILVPMAVGALFAMLLAPLQKRLTRRAPFLARHAHSLLTAATVLLVLLPVTLIVIEAVQSLNEFLQRDWAHTVDSVQRFLGEKLGPYRERFGAGTAGEVRQTIQNGLRQAAGAVAQAAGNIAASLPGLVLDAFLFMVALYYLLRDGGSLAKWLRSMSPFRPDDTDELFASIRETVTGSLLSIVATATVQGVLTMISLYALGVPGAFFFGLAATLLALVPLVGTTPVTMGAALYLLAVGRIGAAIAMVIAAVLIGVSDNVVRPWVQGAQSRMHPLFVLLGIFGGLEMFGISGVFIGPIVAAMAVWTVDTYATLRLKQRGRGMPPSDAHPTPG